MLLNSKLMLAQAAVAFAAPRILRTSATQAIQWAPCEIPDQTMPVLCARYRVPLDYLAHNSSETIELNLYKVAATKQPSRGSILFNFGGPGLPGGPMLAPTADEFLSYTGGSFDLVTLDPRGSTLDTLPFSCFATPRDQKDWESANIAWPWNSSDTRLGENWAIAKVYTDICAKNTNATTSGAYIGTAYTARDYMSVIDALGEDGLLRYWGMSYGTVLGATIAAMFPDRIDRMILDSVVNIHDYWHSQDVERVTDADKAFSKFLEECFDAGEEKCALARSNTTAAAFEEVFYSWLEDDLKYHPIAGPEFVINYSTIKGMIETALYTRKKLPTLAKLINAAMKGEFAADADLTVFETPDIVGDGLYGIECADNTMRTDRIEDVIPFLEKQAQLSRIRGDLVGNSAMKCSQWPVESKERYLGDYNVQTKHPILFIGNTYDAITPFVSAKNASESFPGSALLEHRGFGHCALTQLSICTAKTIQNYFASGKLPEPGTVCEPNVPFFGYNVKLSDIKDLV